MLREPPDATDLLATARDVLLNELLPALPAEKAFAARMVANAMAIAAREAAQDDAWQGAALAHMGGDVRTFAAAIRAGAHDPGTPRHTEVATLLDDVTRARCAVSAPKVIAR
ncbi:DUF6285 domain-containing protein [Roseomonas fluvialis]|uniref:DUF6285 domain-containing protein n=1 Tax=Roseomonas fluvialis TaxID=1750527 RepID=A0ABM7YA44_9PROT|nr:DUF6285 domain-containing protein [Roseomonas fluvialis]BDG74947.1 hypothetical protein Rmf_48760 [Roseomonas fluvialis]